MRPLDLGGLGIPNLEIMAWALQARWQWHKKTRTNRPWTDLELPSHPNSLALFADDVALFIRPVEEELQVTKEILNDFGMASVLRTNLNKSSIIPIQCEEGSLMPVRDILPY